MEKLTISMAIFNSKLFVITGGYNWGGFQKSPIPNLELGSVAQVSTPEPWKLLKSFNKGTMATMGRRKWFDHGSSGLWGLYMRLRCCIQPDDLLRRVFIATSLSGGDFPGFGSYGAGYLVFWDPDLKSALNQWRHPELTELFCFHLQSVLLAISPGSKLWQKPWFPKIFRQRSMTSWLGMIWEWTLIWSKYIKIWSILCQNHQNCSRLTHTTHMEIEWHRNLFQCTPFHPEIYNRFFTIFFNVLLIPPPSLKSLPLQFWPGHTSVNVANVAMSNWKNVEHVEKCLKKMHVYKFNYTASQVLQHTHARTCQDGSWRRNIPCKITRTWVVQCTTFYETKKPSATLSYRAGHFFRSQQIPYLWIIMNYPFRRCMTWTILNILCVFSYTWYIQKQYYDNISYLYINSIIYM